MKKRGISPWYWQEGPIITISWSTTTSPAFSPAMESPVLTVDSLPGFNEVDLSGVRGETVINFHVRMFEAALIAAEHPALELVQIVSFGCGHDAVISDEIIRIMKAGGNKDPLVLKLDESDVPGPLNIRIKSFVETVRAKRARIGKNTDHTRASGPLSSQVHQGTSERENDPGSQPLPHLYPAHRCGTPQRRIQSHPHGTCQRAGSGTGKKVCP